MLRLSSYQCVKIKEILTRFGEHSLVFINRDITHYVKHTFIPEKVAIEELVEDILKTVVPPMYIVGKDNSIKVVYDA